MINDIEHLCMHIFAVPRSSWESVQLIIYSIAHLFFVVVFLLIIESNFCQTYVCKYFLPVCVLLIHFLKSVLVKSKSFKS